MAEISTPAGSPSALTVACRDLAAAQREPGGEGMATDRVRSLMLKWKEEA